MNKKKKLYYGVYVSPDVNGGKPYIETVAKTTANELHRGSTGEHLLNYFTTPEEAQEYLHSLEGGEA